MAIAFIHRTVLITGASQGIGFVLAETFAARGYRVIATHRRTQTPSNLLSLARACRYVVVHRLDVTQHAEIDVLARHIAEPIDVLINNAAVIRRSPLGDRVGNRGQVLGSLNYADFGDFVATNVIGPLKMIEAFLPHLRRGTRKTIVAMSSEAASMTTPEISADHYWYRISKAALNKAIRLAASQLFAEGIIVALINPGGVQVESLGPEQVRGCVAPEIAVPEIVSLIESLTLQDSGVFMRRDGSVQAW